jgi:hypothetical protein
MGQRQELAEKTAASKPPVPREDMLGVSETGVQYTPKWFFKCDSMVNT